jgi:hypothetical protein
MRKPLAALCAVLLLIIVLPVAAQAATEVNVRIEGRAETLFEGPVLAETDAVRAISDTEARRCDGINALDPENVVPAPVPTSVSADAMAILGESFDGQWYPGFDDYFITRWGPDGQSEAEGAYWGVLVNNVFSDVGGCQYQLGQGDEVLWTYDAFHSRPFLALFPEAAHYTSGARPLTATIPFGTPFAVEVASYEDDEEDRPPAIPGIEGAHPFAGAEVAPVVTTAKGFERVNAKASATVKTDGDGKASVSFARPGWHRIKATVVSGGKETVIRSNRLDVCVAGGEAGELENPLEGASTCAEVPAADQTRAAPRQIGELPEPPQSGSGGGTAGTTAGTTPSNPQAPAAAPPAAPLRVSLPKLGRKQLTKGKLTVSWKVQSAGAGVKSWAISSQTVGQKHARYVTRARGATKTSATIKLPPGHSYKLRFAITDRAGETSTVSLGKVQVPRASRRKR